MPTFKPIRQSRVSQEVAEQLKQSILRGEFEPGAKLPSERILSEQFKVSRLSIREALHKLEALGFVLTRQGITGGAYVIDLTFDSLASAFSDLFLAGKISAPELSLLRIVLEPEIAKLAAQTINPESALRLKEAHEAEKGGRQTPLEGFSRKASVHYTLGHMCGNHFFEAILRSAMELTFKYFSIVDINHEDFDRLHPPDAHDPIVEAVLAGDGERAYAAMKKHAIDFGEVLLNLEELYRTMRSNPPSERSKRGR